ncbi:uncharacterized protein LOC117791575 [Drosophila innubila]|uniref:uncharacterized protein LOC117791575 n=1 Tax=Drosophila innubila TaxID=198719 RepID=UPI00148BE582|nr:uncharacterized protein LOC117791575 [Drosophila innubila]
MKLNAIVAMLLLALGPLVSGEAVQSTAKEQIVVHTPLQNYEQPSLRDYDECQVNRQSCVDNCAGNETCESECPQCPELWDEPLLVQGVNDTNYVAPAQPPLNTTNIIRLTNEINNIINNDILSRNEVNVKVHQNVSQVGGRFGLGYNDQGSCCYVIRRERECDHKEHCKEAARHRVCGKRCQSRVMIAKRVVQCEKDQPEECHETLEYVPAHKHKTSARDGHNNRGGRMRRASCQSCLDLRYGDILQYGLPPQCYGCFQGFAVPMMPMAMPMYYPQYSYMPNFGYDNQPKYEPNDEDNEKKENEIAADNDDSDWILDSKKCRGSNGKLEDCVEGSGDFESPVALPPAHLEIGKDNNNNKEDEDDGYNVPAQRRRRRRRQSRRQFMRSLYSHRHGRHGV